MKTRTRVPHRGSSSVQRLCELILGSTNGDPVFLQARPRGDAIPGDCFANVSAVIEDRGGSVVYGWRLWEWPRVFIEGEFHAVWRSPAGDLEEVSRNQLNSPHVLFLPDATTQFDGQQIPNRRLALTEDPLVAEWFSLLDRKYALLNEGELATSFGEVAVRPEILPVMQRCVEIEHELRRRGF